MYPKPNDSRLSCFEIEKRRDNILPDIYSNEITIFHHYLLHD